MATITQLRAFHVVAASKGYSQAARDTAISQSNLSGQVRQLEAASGFALFERGRLGVSLTPEGEMLYAITQRLFGLLDEADAFLRTRRSDGGHLRIASDGVNHALPVLREMHSERPQLTFAMQVLNSDLVLEQLAQFRADVGITARKPVDGRFHVLPFTRMHLGVILPVAHPWSARDTIAIPELQGHPVVLREKGSRTRESFETALMAAQVSLGPAVEISTREGVREAVAAGFGLAAMADLDHVPDPRLVFVPLRGPKLHFDEYLICLKERRRVPVIAHFIRCAAELAAA